VNQNALGFDLNMEDVVEGDDDDDALQMQDQLMLDFHLGGNAAEQQPVVIDLNAPPSIDLDFCFDGF
jgi:hypothetical protein